MSFWKRISALALLSLPYINQMHGANFNWTNPAGGNWNVGSNWSTGSVPNSVSSDVFFSQLSGQTGNITITQNIATFPYATVRNATFSTTSPASYTLQGTGLAKLILDSGSSTTAATINMNGGSHTVFNSALAFVFGNSPLAINMNQGSLTINHNALVTVGSFPLTVSGPGTLILQDGQIGGDNGTISINNGNVNAITTVPSPSLGSGIISSGNATVSISNHSNITLTSTPNISINAINVAVVAINVLVSDSTINAVNAASISSSNGIGIIMGGTQLAFTGGTSNFTNNGSITGKTAFGILLAGQQTTINGGTLNLTNNGLISNTNSFGIALVNGINDSIIVNGGTLHLSNTGSIQGNGIVSSQASFGVSIGPCANFIMTDGLLTLNNTGVTSGPVDFGCFLGSLNISQSGGTVINNAIVATNNYNLSSAGVFAGSGAVRPALIGSPSLQFTNSGTVVPGGPNPTNAPGTINVQGSYTQTSSGKFVANIQNLSSFSQLLISETAQLNGTLEVAETSGGNINPGETYTVLVANGGISGTFSHIEDFHTPYLIPHVSYVGNTVQVLFSPSLFPDPSGEDDTINGGLKVSKTAKGGYVNLSRPIFSSVNETYVRLTREMERVRSHFTKPTAAKIAASEKPSLRSSELPTELTSLKMNRDVEFFVSQQTNQSVLPQEKTQRLSESLGAERSWNFYVGPKGQIGNVVSERAFQGYSHWSTGAFTGFDYAFSQVGVGLIAEYEYLKAQGGKKWGKFSIDSVHTDAYLTYAPRQLPEFSINAIVGGGYEWFDIDRRINQGIAHMMDGSPNGAEFDTLLGIEYAFRDSVFSAMPANLQIIPLASVQYTYLHIDDYKESGFAPFAIGFSAQNVKSLRTNLGFRINYTWKTQNIDISPEANFSWQREYLDKERSIDVTPLMFPQFAFGVDFPEMGRNTALAGFDLLLTLFGRHGIEAGYDFEYNPQYHTHFFYMDYNVRF